MPRPTTVAAAQMGPIAHEATNPGGPQSREPAMQRMLKLLEDAAVQGAQLVVYPELALTTFFPRAMLTDSAEVAALFEPESDAPGAPSIVDSPHLSPLLTRAKELGIDISIGYAERWTDFTTQTTTDYNTAIYYSAKTGGVVGKYRKVHLPGRTTLLPEGQAQQLEKYYFTPGNLGFQAFRVPSLPSTSEPEEGAIVGMIICNDRRWVEAWRCLGLQGVELVLCGYNTSDYKPQDSSSVAEQIEMALLHHHISCQAGSYTNACFSVNVAKAGVEAAGAGGGLIGGTVIYDPLGRKVGETKTLGDELLVATLDLDDCQKPKATIFNFANHRRVEHYARIVEQVGVEPPK